MELRWPRGTVIRNQVSWRLPFPVPGSDPFPSYRGCQRPEGPTPGFWEVAPRKAKNVSAKVSNKILTTRVHHRDPHLLPWIPLRAKQILPELPSPPAHHSFLPESHVRARLLQGPGELAEGLAGPLSLTVFPDNPGLPSKRFLDPILSLILPTGKTETERKNGLVEVKQPLKGTPLFLIF